MMMMMMWWWSWWSWWSWSWWSWWWWWWWWCAGVHTASNIDDNVKCSYLPCLLGACIPLPILLFSSKLDTFITYSCLCSVLVANMYGTQARHKPKSDDTCQAWICLSVANLLMMVMLISALYHNCSVTTRDGVEIPLRDAFHNILVSPAWAEFRQTVLRLFHCLVNEGLHKFVYEFRIVLDPEGEVSAYKVSCYQYVTCTKCCAINHIRCNG